MTDLLPDSITSSVFLRRDALAAWDVARGDCCRRPRRRLGATATWCVRAGELCRRATAEERHALLARAVVRAVADGCRCSDISRRFRSTAAELWSVPTDVVHVTRLDRRAGRQGGWRPAAPGPAPRTATWSCATVSRSRRPTRTRSMSPRCADVEAGARRRQQSAPPASDDTRWRRGSATRRCNTGRGPSTTDLVRRLADPRIESVAESRTFILFWRQAPPAPRAAIVV